MLTKLSLKHFQSSSGATGVSVGLGPRLPGACNKSKPDFSVEKIYLC